VLPVSEDATRLLALRAPDLGGAVVAGPTAAQYAALCDKAALGETAARAGVGSPARAVAGAGGASPALPSIVKARSAEPVPDALDHPVVAPTAGARHAALARLLDAGVGAVVEELVEGPHWSVTCVRDAEGGVASVVARIVRTFPREAGMPSLLVVAGDAEPASAAAGRLLASVGYRGPANLQMLERDGEMLVHDANLRIPATVAMAMAAGVDVPALAVEAALGGRVPSRPRPGAAGLRYLSLVDELRAGGSPRELAGAALSRRAVLDPPPRDPLWVPARALAAARRAVRRVRGRA
jgi:hypothetical protein